ncbi:MAG: hypothetical protein KAX84_01790 [Burkholderiales bacterium]|nr:hypothetical protein [Betaproteobacteria bacterium]MBP8294808.1 hypothetical protein [Burkholderiales bacterium]
MLVAATATVRAAAGDPPPSSLDLGASKPKADTTVAKSPAAVVPIGQSLLSKQKAAAEAGAAPGIGSAIKSPLGVKGILGGPATGAKPAQEDAATSNDVVVKMPSNMKK